MKNFYFGISLWVYTIIFFSCQNINTQTCTNLYWYPNEKEFNIDSIKIDKLIMECFQISSRLKKYEIISIQIECSNFDEYSFNNLYWENFYKNIALHIYQKNLDKDDLKAIVIEIYKRLENGNPTLKFEFPINDLITQ